MTRPPLRVLLLAAALGGALGACARYGVTEAFPARGHAFPWATFGINVTGSFLLGVLPAFTVVRRITWLPVFLGTGVLGGFTTMSAAVVAPAQHWSSLYLLGTLAASLMAAYAGPQWAAAAQRAEFEDEEGDE